MNILLVGSGGREHALAWKIVQSPVVRRLVCAPGNPGIAGLCETRPVRADDIVGLVALARDLPADLVVIGPDAAIAAGLADRLADAGIACFGPTAAAGRLESSKAFAKAFAERHGLPAGRFAVFDDAEQAKAALGDYTAPYVIKADGLAAGKGVVIAPDRPAAEAAIDDALNGRFGAAGSRVLIEEFLVGEVVSVFALCDGETVVMLGGAQDHKPAFDGDRGPNTGGMGAYAPAPALDAAMMEQVRGRLIAPTLAGIAVEGAPYRGVLFCETMITAEGPKLIEFNARFGDPEKPGPHARDEERSRALSGRGGRRRIGGDARRRVGRCGGDLRRGRRGGLSRGSGHRQTHRERGRRLRPRRDGVPGWDRAAGGWRSGLGRRPDTQWSAPGAPPSARRRRGLTRSSTGSTSRVPSTARI